MHAVNKPKCVRNGQGVITYVVEIIKVFLHYSFSEDSQQSTYVAAAAFLFLKASEERPTTKAAEAVEPSKATTTFC